MVVKGLWQINQANLMKKLKKWFNLTVQFLIVVDPNENCFPMIPSGKPYNQMILGLVKKMKIRLL